MYRSLWRHHVHWWHSILLTTAVHVTDRHHGVDVAWLIGNHRNFGLRLHDTKSTPDIIVTLINLPLFSDNNINDKIKVVVVVVHFSHHQNQCCECSLDSYDK